MKREEIELCRNELNEMYNQNCREIESTNKHIHYLQKEHWRKKSKYERLELEINLKIKQKKLEYRNQVIQKTLESLKKEEDQIQEFSKKYTIIENRTESKEAIEENLQNTKSLLKEQYEKLDIVSTRETLANEFASTRWSRGNKILDVALRSCFIGLIVAACALPIVNLLELEMYLFILFGSAISYGSVATRTYHKEKKVFRKLNKNLGKYAILESNRDEPERILEKETQQVVEDTSKIQAQLQEQTRLLESSMDEPIEEQKSFKIRSKTNFALPCEERFDMTKSNGKRKIKRIMISKDYQ